MSQKIEGTLIADGSTGWFIADHDCDGVSFSAKGSFDSGTLKVEERIQGSVYDVIDSSDTAVSGTSNFSRFLQLRKGDVVRLTLTGSQGSADIDWKLNGKLTTID